MPKTSIEEHFDEYLYAYDPMTKTPWQAKSRAGRVGRPRIPRKHIDFISRISQEHPEWGEDRICEELSAKFGVSHATPTRLNQWHEGRDDKCLGRPGMLARSRVECSKRRDASWTSLATPPPE